MSSNNEGHSEDLQTLMKNGFTALEAKDLLDRFGSAEVALLNKVNGESTFAMGQLEEGKASYTHEAELGEQYAHVIKAAKSLDWTGVDVRRTKRSCQSLQAGEVADTILRQGVEFFRQAVSSANERAVIANSRTMSFAADTVKPGTGAFEENVKLLVEMGFEQDQALAALIQCDGHVDQALGLLTG